MEATDLTSSSFWESDANHIAVNPLRPADGSGLAEFARIDLTARGWCFFQTSGSEGKPKWVGLTKEAFLISARAVNEFFKVTSADRWLVALPLHHVGGFSIHARCFASGARLDTMTGDWSAQTFADLCANHHTTLASLVPTQVFDLVRDKVTAPPSVRAVIVGGGALARELQISARELGWPMCASYGMTEAASQIATQSIDATDAMEVLPHWVANTNGDDVLTIRGPALAKGFATRDEDGSWQWEPIDATTGLQTRDRVIITQAGTKRLLQFVGRESGFIKICGELVNSDALQSRMDETARQTGFTTRAVVVPLHDPRRETALVVVFESGKSSEAERTHLIEQYNTTSQPFERIQITREVESIPLSELGKVQIAKLVTWLETRL